MTLVVPTLSAGTRGLSHCNAAMPAIAELLGACVPHFRGTVVSYVPGQEVVGEGDPTDNFFLVRRGFFRAVNFTPDGRRQVFAFYTAGDLCGLEPDATHKLTIEAVDCAAMVILPRGPCRIWMNDSPEISRALFDGATRALTLTIDHMMMIGRNSADERIAWFLTMLGARSADPSARVFDLAMQRQDIADYLGLTIETVSRTFTHFRDRGLIDLLSHSRHVHILRPHALARLAAADRDAEPTDLDSVSQIKSLPLARLPEADVVAARLTKAARVSARFS